MPSILCPKDLLNPIPTDVDKASEAGLASSASATSPISKPAMCRSEPGVQMTRHSNAVTIHADAVPSAQSNHCLKEQFFKLPLRLALAKRTVKRQIFASMDHGDRKADIESSTGLSHQCIKWHRFMWRVEGSHPRPPPRGNLKPTSIRGLRSSSLPRGRLSRKRRDCVEGADAGGLGAEKRRRGQRVVDREEEEECSGRAGVERAGGGRRRRGVGREVGGCVASMDKENIPDGGGGVWMAGEKTVLPLRGLGAELE
ncbi:hypothetical protein BDR22DRAFT_42162 [Usnea florida]